MGKHTEEEHAHALRLATNALRQMNLHVQAEGACPNCTKMFLIVQALQELTKGMDTIMQIMGVLGPLVTAATGLPIVPILTEEDDTDMSPTRH